MEKSRKQEISKYLHCLQQLEHGSKLDVHQQMNGYIQWNVKEQFESVLMRWKEPKACYTE